MRWHGLSVRSTPVGTRRATRKNRKEYMELLFEVNYADTCGKNPKRIIRRSSSDLRRQERLYKK